MPNVIDYRPDSEDLERLTAGYVMAERINDVVAKFDTKRHRNYLQIVKDQLVDPAIINPDDAWRHKELVPRALDAYELRHGVSVDRGRLYALHDYRIACAPHAVEGDTVGLTVHCRQTMETYEDAVRIGGTPEIERHAQACMWVTGLRFWLHLDYFEDPELRVRRLHEHDFYAHKQLREQMGDALVSFYQRSVLGAARRPTT